MKPVLVIVDYDPKWPGLFKEEERRLLGAFSSDQVDVQHIGSTAVDGLGAKPILDLLAGVPELKVAERRIADLAALGYEYVAKYESTLPERRYFRKTGFHLHCVVKESRFWCDHLLFRDYLRKHPATARSYLTLKRRLARQFQRDHQGYTDAKSRFIEEVLLQAKAEE